MSNNPDGKSDPKPRRTPVGPGHFDEAGEPEGRGRPNRPVGPSGDETELSVETPPEEVERDRDPRSRDAL